MLPHAFKTSCIFHQFFVSSRCIQCSICVTYPSVASGICSVALDDTGIGVMGKMVKAGIFGRGHKVVDIVIEVDHLTTTV